MRAEGDFNKRQTDRDRDKDTDVGYFFRSVNFPEMSE